jgi:hypothetical protein
VGWLSNRLPALLGLAFERRVGVFELAQGDERVAGGEPDHVRRAGERQRVAVGQYGKRCGDLQPGRDVDQRVGLVGLQGRTRLRCRCLGVNVAVPGIAGHRPRAARPALVSVG